MAKGKILKSLVKKKPSGIKKSTPRYVKTASGMKLNPERFKQAPKAERLKQTKAAKKSALKDTAAIGAAGVVGFAGGKLDSAKKAKAKDKKRQLLG